MEPGAAAPEMVAVAWSGGRDSTALLHAVLQAARVQGGLEVLALHVHHGLLREADDWLAHCGQLAAQWRDEGLPLRLAHRRLALRIRTGDSLEAEARRARYAALRDMALEHGAREIWLAHHRRDQAETFLLQALRGAGVAGLSGMPREIDRGGILWVRPWLDRPREALEAYVAQHRLIHVDDPSNADTRLARNRLRLAVWPALLDAFPSAEATLADSARRAQDARACLADLAQLDLEGLLTPQGIDVDGLRALPPHRVRNALRAWFLTEAGRVLPATLCERLMKELPRAAATQWPTCDGSLALYRGRLAWQPDRCRVLPLEALSPPDSGPPAEPLPSRGGDPGTRPESRLRLNVPGDYRAAGWWGVLRVRTVAEHGLDPALLEDVRLTPRQGGERFQFAPARPARSLKKQYQSLGVPAWQRDGPLLWAGERLLYVPGLGIDARAWAAPGEPQLSLDWLPDAG